MLHRLIGILFLGEVDQRESFRKTLIYFFFHLGGQGKGQGNEQGGL